MNIDDIEKRFMTTSRLLRRKKIALEESSLELDLGQCADFESARVCGTDTDPVLLISLRKLEDALRGFRDTGTWGDYFHTPVDTDGDGIVLTSPSRGGRANYKLDIDDDDGDSG